jgi:anti-sigma B factor antagonist
MVQLKVVERQSRGVTILDLEGDITFGEGTTTLRKETRRLILGGRPNILLNLASVRYVDSSALGEMVSALLAARRENGRMALLNVTPNVWELFEMTRLATVFDTYSDEQAACKEAGGG